MEISPEIREGMYSFLSYLYNNPPDEEHLKILEDEDVKNLFNFFSPQAEKIFKWRDELKKIRDDFFSLFMVPGEKYVKPYESVYVDKKIVEGEVKNGLLMGPSTLEVMKLYKRAGFKLNSSVKELPDYIGIEINFMVELIRDEKKIIHPDKGGMDILKMEFDFLKNHLSKWAGQLADEISNKADTEFYRGVAFLTRDFINFDLKFLENEVSR